MSWSQAATIRTARTFGLRGVALIGIALLGVVSPARSGELHEKFIEQLAATPSSSFVTGLVMVADQVDLARVDQELLARNELSSRAHRHRAVIRSAQELAHRTQAPLLAQLADWKLQGKVDSYRSYWVTNMISVTARPEIFDVLAARPDVGTIYMNEPVPVRLGEDANGDREASEPAQSFVLPDNLVCINVESAWDRGFRGNGRLVAAFDSGADGNHPALASRWRGAQPGVNWWEAWKDPYTGTTFPYDARTHGTHVLGIMVAETPLGGAVGVAPGASWIAAGATIQFDAEKIIECYEWAADPDGDPETIDDVPDVINNSWGTTGDCQTTFWNAIDLVEAAGVVNTIAVDNRGPFPMSVNSPESRAESPTVNFSVGNVNSTDPSYPIYPTSGRGPSPCDSVSIKPELTAPGTMINSTVPGGGYDLKTGASQAAPHTSAAVAILRQVDPDLSVEDIKLILMSTAADKGDPGEDNTYGWGILDIGAAVDSVLARLPRVPPANLTASAQTDSVSLSWERPAPIHVNNPLLHYRVYRASGSDPFPSEPIAEPSDTAAVVYFDDLELAWGEYRYAVTAVYELDESGPSNEAAVGVFPAEPVTDLTASVSVDTIRVEWNRPDPIHPENPLTGYRIYRAPADGPYPDDPIAVSSDTSAVLEYMDEPLPAGTYRYAIVAEYEWNESPRSADALATIHPFDPPTDLSYTVNADSISLSWARPANVAPENPIELYRIYRAIAGEPLPGTPLAEVSDTSVTVGYLDPNVPFLSLEYAVTALYASTESDTSLHMTVLDSVWETAPFNLIASVAADSIRLDWNRPRPVHPDNPISGYRIWRADAEGPFPDDPIAEIADDALDPASYVDREVPIGAYRYAVSAVYDSGESARSADAFATIYPSEPPENLTAVPSADGVELQWHRPQTVDRENPVLSFRVYRSLQSEPFTEEPIAEVSDTSEVVSFLDSPVPFADLRWRVTALYLTSESPPSNEAFVSEEMWMNEPQSLSATVVGDSVALTWSRPEPVHPDNPIVHYRLFAASDDEPFGEPIAEVVDPLATVEHIDPHVPFGDRRYVVTALYAAAESDSSNEAAVSRSAWLSAPAQLAVDVTDDDVALSWDRPSPLHPDAPLVSYRLFRAEGGTPYGPPVAEIADTMITPAYLDSNVPFDDLSYVVTALYTEGESDSSDAATVPRETWLTPARNLAASVAVDSVTLTWEAPAPLHPSSPPLGYEIYRALQGDPFPDEPIGTVDAESAAIYGDPELPVGDYVYAVGVVYPEVESDLSNQATASVYPRDPPHDLSATVAADSVSLHWSVPELVHPDNPVLLYRIYRSRFGEPFGSEPVGESTDTDFVDMGVPFDSLQYAVTALYANTESVASDLEAIPADVWASTPEGLVAVVAADSVELSWNRPAPIHPDNGLILYRVYRTTLGDPFGPIPLAEVTDPAAVVQFQDLGVPYADLEYMVTAVYAASAESDSSGHAIVLDEVWNAPPFALVSEVSADSVRLEWSRPSNVHPANPIASFRIYRSDWQEPFGAPLGEIDDSLTIYLDAGVPLDSLRYAVTALYTAGESDYSDHATVDERIWFAAPEIASAVAHGDSVHLEWLRPGPIHPENDIVHYRLYRAPSGEPFGEPVAEVSDPAQLVIHEDPDVPPGAQDYAVGALYAAGEGDLSEIVQVVVSNPSGVGDVVAAAALMLRIVPNPFEKEAAVHFAPVGTGPLAIDIFDVSGARVRELFRSPGGRVEERFLWWDGTDGNGHPVGTGTYFVRFLEGSRSVTRRVVLIR